VLATSTNPPELAKRMRASQAGMMPGWRCLRIAMSEWSWDAPGDSMERTCARAVEMGLPAVAFTEHADYTTWKVVASDFAGHEQLTAFVTPDGTLTPPRLDLDGYLECVQRCRDQFPNLRVISGVELGEAHRHSDVAAKLLDAGQFDRVLASLHTLPVGQQFFEPPGLYRNCQRPRWFGSTWPRYPV
jgi:histidinol-phosphatase (PHP family)